MNQEQKIEITQTLRDRLISLEKSHGLNHVELISRTGINEHTYKNLFHETGTQKNINIDFLNAIAEYYECTIDYITGKSSVYDEYENSIRRIKPSVNFSERNKKINNITSYLRSKDNSIEKYEFIKNMDFIINKLSDSECLDIIKGFNASISLLRENTIFQYKDSMAPNTFELLRENFKTSDAECIKLLNILSEAENAYSKGRYKKSYIYNLRVLLESMKISSPNTTDIKKRSVKNLILLRNKRSELCKVPEYPNFENSLNDYYNNPFYNFPDDFIETVQKYIDANPNVK